MKIRLLTQQKEVLYELEETELFPDYSSVLREAIAYNVDLTGLFIDSKCIDNVIWREINMKGITIKNCSMRRAKLIECDGDNLRIEACDLTDLKVIKSKLDGLHILNSNLTHLSFRDSCSKNSFIIDTNCSNPYYSRFQICVDARRQTLSI